ncbi:MAG: hypothetical protein V1796_01450 [Pseudomonadota bacterium]
MKLRSSRFSALVAVAACALCGCASAPQSGVERQAAEVKVYEPEQLVQGQYEVVRYLWVDSWRTAFRLRCESSEAAGIAALQAEAARLGANGLINVSCRDQGHFTWSRSREPAILCYGNAIRVR